MHGLWWVFEFWGAYAYCLPKPVMLGLLALIWCITFAQCVGVTCSVLQTANASELLSRPLLHDTAMPCHLGKQVCTNSPTQPNHWNGMECIALEV